MEEAALGLEVAVSDLEDLALLVVSGRVERGSVAQSTYSSDLSSAGLHLIL